MLKTITTIILIATTISLSGCFIVTTPVKVGADVAHTAADVA